jgi:tetratricopeptide (TPR) repeat protein
MKPVPCILILCTLPARAGEYAPRADLDAGRYLKALADAEAQLRHQPKDALAWAAKSQALTALVRLPEAMEAADKAMALNPRLPDALQARALAKGGIAFRQINLGSLRLVSDAMDDLKAALEIDPALASAWTSLGLAYELLPGFFGGSTRRALECADNLGKVNPVRGDVLRGTVLSMEGRWGEAQPCFNRALAAAPKDPEVLYAYLDALGSRETRKAIGPEPQKKAEAQEARRLLPSAQDRARPITAICDALLDADQGEEAWRVCREALPRTDAPSLLRLQLGKIAARSGVHREEGLAALDQVLREPLEGGSGGYGTAHWRRGQVLRDLGRKDEARAAARAALAIDPKDSKARRLLEELK